MTDFARFKAFVTRFPDNTEIGRDIQPDTLSIYYDDGKDVGMVRTDRRTTAISGYEVLSPQDADAARDYYKPRHADRVKGELSGFIEWMRKRPDVSDSEKDRLESMAAEFQRGRGR